MAIDLPFIWAGLIAFAVLAYVVLDGFDLGVGILFPLAKDKHDRDVMMNSVAPVWDGNETWLVLGGGGLMAVFPLAYATVLPALYAPLIAMLLGLVLRGVAFEFRWRTKRGQFLWDWAFSGGSLIATFAQGMALGALVQGIPVINRTYSGGWWDWFTLFTLLTGRSSGYGLFPAGRHLAGHENRRRAAGKITQAGMGYGCRHNCPHRCRKPVDAIFETHLFRALVCLARHALQRHCPPAGFGLHLWPLHWPARQK